jgi:hypothetical protein
MLLKTITFFLRLRDSGQTQLDPDFSLHADIGLAAERRPRLLLDDPPSKNPPRNRQLRAAD